MSDERYYAREEDGSIVDGRTGACLDEYQTVQLLNRCASIPDPAALVEAARRALRVLESDEDIDDSAADAVTVRQVLAQDLRTALNPEEPRDGKETD